MIESLRALMELVQSSWPFTPPAYPELKGDSDPRAIVHAAMHLAKSSGKVVGAIEPIDHGKPVDRDALTEQLSYTLVNLLRIASLAGISSRELLVTVENWKQRARRMDDKVARVQCLGCNGYILTVAPGVGTIREIECPDCGAPVVVEFADTERFTPPLPEHPETGPALSSRCQAPPPGWVCSRDRGHDGPCAARLVPEDLPRIPPGHVGAGYINNCSLAFGDDAKTCQMCGGTCPDVARFGYG